jgi:hypothetical protein
MDNDILVDLRDSTGAKKQIIRYKKYGNVLHKKIISQF